MTLTLLEPETSSTEGGPVIGHLFCPECFPMPVTMFDSATALCGFFELDCNFNSSDMCDDYCKACKDAKICANCGCNFLQD